jgi:y4mF family transcriptional regulator
MYLRRPRDFGALIRDRRKALELTQSDLANRLKVSRRWVGYLEKGDSNARLDLVLSALTALGVKLWADIGDGVTPPGATPPDGDRIDMAALVDQMLDKL